MARSSISSVAADPSRALLSMRPSECMQAIERELAAARRSRSTPIMLWGPPGIGKSRIVAAAAARATVKLIDIRLAQMEPTDLRGIPFRDGARVTWAAPALLPDAARDGEAGVLFLDEITSAVPTVTAAAYQLILDRRLGEYEVPVGWTIIAAGNRHGDRGVTYAMPAPLANRFVHYEIEPDLDDWVEWAFASGLDARLIAFLRFRPDLLFSFDPARHGAAFPSPRSWEFADRALEKFGHHAALLGESLKGCVGAAAAVAFQAYLRHVDALPDPALVFAGQEVAVPTSVELEYAFATAIAQAFARTDAIDRRLTAEIILRLARRFPHREIGVMLVADVQRIVGAPLIESPAFVEWAAEVSDLVSYVRS